MALCVYCGERIENAAHFVGGEPMHPDCYVQWGEDCINGEDTSCFPPEDGDDGEGGHYERDYEPSDDSPDYGWEDDPYGYGWDDDAGY